MTCEDLLITYTDELHDKQAALATLNGQGSTLEQLQETGFAYGALPLEYVVPMYRDAARMLGNSNGTYIVRDSAASCGSVPSKYPVPPATSDWIGTLTEIPRLEQVVSISGPGVVKAHGISSEPGAFLSDCGYLLVPVMLIYTYGTAPSIPYSTYSRAFSIGTAKDCGSLLYTNGLLCSDIVSPIWGGTQFLGAVALQIGQFMLLTGTHDRAQSGYGNIAGSGSITSTASRSGKSVSLSISISRG